MDGVTPASAKFSGVLVAQVLDVASHPTADRLRICRVDTGTGTLRTIVCGAPNVEAGRKVPCALPGAKLPGKDVHEASIRGVASSGMLCSAQELGLNEESSGLLLLPADAPVGADFRVYYELDDCLITLKLTSNRGDCLSVSGIARDVAALTATPLHPVEVNPVAACLPDTVSVRVEAADACRRYCGRVIRGVNVGATTPLWMARRLEKSGVRSISAVVDVTNYVMLELGQPLHAFDLAKLGGGIHVRFARPGERLLCLNEQDAVLSPDYLVIADDAGPVALAGIMGGARTAVGAETVDLFLESAFFDPSAVAGRSRKLGFATDSSHRFERGVDFEITARAMERATALVVEFCGGKPGPVTDLTHAAAGAGPSAITQCARAEVARSRPRRGRDRGDIRSTCNAHTSRRRYHRRDTALLPVRYRDRGRSDRRGSARPRLRPHRAPPRGFEFGDAALLRDAEKRPRAPAGADAARLSGNRNLRIRRSCVGNGLRHCQRRQAGESDCGTDERHANDAPRRPARPPPLQSQPAAGTHSSVRGRQCVSGDERRAAAVASRRHRLWRRAPRAMGCRRTQRRLFRCES